MLRRAFNGFHGRFTSLHPFKSSILYSTSATSKDGVVTDPSIADYLVKSVGFSKQEAVSIVTKVSLPSKFSAKKSKLVVEFLKNSGFDEAHIRRLLTSSPKVLRCKIDKTLEPKIRAFQELGLSGSDVGFLISKNPNLFYRSLKSVIAPSLEMLKSVLGSNEQLVDWLLKTRAHFWGFLKNLPSNLLFMQSYGVPSGVIKQLLLKRPLLLGLRTRYLEKTVRSVEEKLGIPRNSPMFFHGVYALSTMSEDGLESSIRLFHSHGWSENEISRLSRKNPYTLCKPEKTLRFKLKYFMEDLGFGSDYLATHPALLTYSMEKRIVPRTAIMKALVEKQLLKYNESYYCLMCKAECKFVAKYVLPIKDELPQLYEYYMQQTSSGDSL